MRELNEGAERSLSRAKGLLVHYFCRVGLKLDHDMRVEISEIIDDIFESCMMQTRHERDEEEKAARYLYEQQTSNDEKPF